MLSLLVFNSLHAHVNNSKLCVCTSENIRIQIAQSMEDALARLEDTPVRLEDTTVGMQDARVGL